MQIVQVKLGKDKRERLFSLTQTGKRTTGVRATKLGARRAETGDSRDAAWKKMSETVSQMTEAAIGAYSASAIDVYASIYRDQGIEPSGKEPYANRPHFVGCAACARHFTSQAARNT